MQLSLSLSRAHLFKIFLTSNLHQLPQYFQLIPLNGIRKYSVSQCIKSEVRVSVPDRRQVHFLELARSTHLMLELVRRGKILDARDVFDKIPDKDVIAWTTMISGYIKFGMIEEARLLFDQPFAKRNVVTWTSLLSGYFRLKKVSEAEALFWRMPEKNVVSWNTMIAGYAEVGRVFDAYQLFKKMPERNTVSWNTMLTALFETGQLDKACNLFGKMPERDVVSWTAMVAGLSRNGRLDEARELFDKMPERNVVSWNAMITGYSQNMQLHKALDLFRRMPERDLPSWNTMITGFIQNGDMKHAAKLFNKMSERNVVTWTTMITGYTQDGQCEEALKIFYKMQKQGSKPNQGTFVSVLSACSSLAGLGEGKQMHQMIHKTIYQFDAFVESSLMSMYSKCGEIGTARQMFDRSNLSHKDVVSWNTMIAAYAHHGNGIEAIRLFEEMETFGLEPNEVSYVGVLAACGHSGLVDEGLKHFHELLKCSTIQVREDHYACLVDLCGRAGWLEEAVNIIDSLETKSSARVWGALLAGCNVHGNVKIGKLAAKKLLALEPDNAGTYMLMSNIYASAGKWKGATKVRLNMKNKGLKKQPGCSWIEVANQVHVFVVRDKSHREAEKIYDLVHDLHLEMKKQGYDPAMDQTVWDDSFMIDIYECGQTLSERT